MAKRPNFVITFSDDQPAYAAGCYGNPMLRTPAMDALAERGCVFDNACNPGSSIGAVCAPSRAMLFTGQFLWDIPNLYKGWWEEGCERFEAANPDPVCTPMLGEILRRHGYHSFLTGKWHNTPFAVNRNFNDGEAIWFHGGNVLQRDLMKPKMMPDQAYGRRREQILDRGKQHWKHTVHGYDPMGEWNPWNSYHDPRHGTEIFTEAAVNFIDTYDGDAPFFLFVPYFAPHNPLETFQEWHDQYPAESMKLPENYQREIAFDNGGLLTKERLEEGWQVKEETAREWIAGLYALTAHMDDGLRRIHEALERNGYLDDTVVVHSGDHGKSSGHHGFQGKWTLYEHDLRVPLIMAGPDVPKGGRSSALVHQHDLHPTLLEMAGVNEYDAYFESLNGVLAGATGREHLFAADRATMRMARDQRYKLIEYRHDPLLNRGVHRTELFDLQKDPHEMRDLSEQPELAGVVEGLRAKLSEWMMQRRDPMLSVFADNK